MSPDSRDDVIRECERDLRSGNGISLDDYEKEQDRARSVGERRDERERRDRDEPGAR
jgi:hypothetical protein